MLFELLCYFPIVNIINLGIFLFLEYISDSDMFMDNIKTYAINISLWGIEKYTICKDLCMKYIYPYIREYLEEQQTKYTYYNKHTREIKNVQTVPIDVIENGDNYKVYYNHTINTDAENTDIFRVELFTTSDFIEKVTNASTYKKQSPFIQLEIHTDNDTRFDIGSSVKEYLIPGNIFDTDFYVYILQKYHNHTLTNTNYTVKCMDTNINMNTFESNQIITITEDGYTSSNIN